MAPTDMVVVLGHDTKDVAVLAHGEAKSFDRASALAADRLEGQLSTPGLRGAASPTSSGARPLSPRARAPGVSPAYTISARPLTSLI